MSDYLDLNNEELLKDFFAEAEQQVENLESNILVIENDPTNHEAVDEIFRAAHTLKGGSATVEMTELSGFTHAVEDLLDELRSGTVEITGDVVDILLSSIDIIKEMLSCRQNGTIYEDDVSPIKEKLASFIPEKGEKKNSAAKNRGHNCKIFSAETFRKLNGEGGRKKSNNNTYKSCYRLSHCVSEIVGENIGDHL